MENVTCKAITSYGEQCQLRAGLTGYCHIHDPQKIQEREEARERQKVEGQHMQEVLHMIKATCDAKGWKRSVSKLDREKWQYASVNVERRFQSADGSTYVNAVLDVTVDETGVKIAFQQTSPRGYGLQDLIDEVQSQLDKSPWLQSSKPVLSVSDDALQKVMRLLKRFHTVARQLRSRHDNRSTLIIGDEYDVQDLLHALLKSIFDDVRPEETTPSYAGGSSRVDFLLKREKIVVEAKMASTKLRDRLVGEQLIIDIKRYQVHPDCKMLVCFVYDPEGYIENAAALENDLNGKHNKLEVRVIVVSP